MAKYEPDSDDRLGTVCAILLSTLGATDKLILIGVACASSRGPSSRLAGRVAELSSLSRQTVKTHIANLRKHGVLAPGAAIRFADNYTAKLDAVVHDTGTKPRQAAKAKAPDPIWDAVVYLFYPSGVPDGRKPYVGGIVRDLKQLGADPAGIAQRLQRWSQVFPGATATPKALVAHWDALRPSASKTAEQQAKGRYGD